MSPTKRLQCWHFKKRGIIGIPGKKDMCNHPDRPNKESDFTEVKCQGDPNKCDFKFPL